MQVFPENSINSEHLSNLESSLYLIDFSQNVALLYLKEKGPFGSLRTDAFVRKALAQFQELNKQGYYVLPIIDGDSSYVLRPIGDKDKEALERRINYQGPWKPKLLEILQEQIKSVPEEKRQFIQLSRAEDRFYHLLTVNNQNELGFPGTWMLYYIDNNGFWIQKIEPILIIPSCLVCPYGMIETIVSEGHNMEKKEKEILQRLNYEGEKRRRNRPYDCPNSQCDLVFSHNEYGRIYRPSERAFSFPIYLDETGAGFSIVEEETPNGLKIAKIVGALRRKN